ncbi:MAG: hypothetical protein KBF88_15775, partial [Polyangiaceae bacterium]|nr:hypothetical protein [Polyangiaceae bacterium]
MTPNSSGPPSDSQITLKHAVQDVQPGLPNCQSGWQTGEGKAAKAPQEHHFSKQFVFGTGYASRMRMDSTKGFRRLSQRVFVSGVFVLLLGAVGAGCLTRPIVGTQS